MSPLTIAPTNVNALLFLTDNLQGLIQHLNMRGRNFEKFIVRNILKQYVAGQGQIWTIQQQIKAGRRNRLLFLAHCIGQGSQTSHAGFGMIILKTAKPHPDQ